MPRQPGAGGGGAGAIGEDQLRAMVGQEAPWLSGLLEVEPGDNLEIEIGGPGERSRSSGGNMDDGGDIVIKLNRLMVH